MRQPSVIVRAARAGDDPGIAGVARGNGQPDPRSGGAGGYVAHLRGRGTLLVAELDGAVVGYGATVGVGAASMLTDLFVDPVRHGAGIGKALLAALWPARRPQADRFTFASQDPRAMPVYVRAGLSPYWPLLYLRGIPAATPAPPLRAVRVPPAEAARAERRLTGAARGADLAFLAGGDPAGGLLVTRDGELVAAGAGVPGSLAHLACPDPAAAADAVVAALHALGGGEASVCLPGPHGAVPRLLAAGYRITDFDLYMATRPELLATSSAYSPSLA
jgi:GNAT superfamily N-acetyltransferase